MEKTKTIYFYGHILNNQILIEIINKLLLK